MRIKGLSLALFVATAQTLAAVAPGCEAPTEVAVPLLAGLTKGQSVEIAAAAGLSCPGARLRRLAIGTKKSPKQGEYQISGEIVGEPGIDTAGSIRVDLLAGDHVLASAIGSVRLAGTKPGAFAAPLNGGTAAASDVAKAPEAVRLRVSLSALAEADEQMIVGCKFLGDVYGKTLIGGMANNMAIRNAKSDAKTKAAGMGATHIVFRVLDGGDAHEMGHTEARAYRCGS